jgi:hypothetical protein
VTRNYVTLFGGSSVAGRSPHLFLGGSELTPPVAEFRSCGQTSDALERRENSGPSYTWNTRLCPHTRAGSDRARVQPDGTARPVPILTQLCFMTLFSFFLSPPGGSRGRVRTVVFLRSRGFGPDPRGGGPILIFIFILTLSTAGLTFRREGSGRPGDCF